MEPLIDIARRPAVRRAALGVYVAIVAGLLAGFFYVSLLQVDYAAYVQAAPELERGRPNPMRALVLHAPSGRRFDEGDVDIELVDAEYGGPEMFEHLDDVRRAPIGSAGIEPSGYVHLATRAPSELGDERNPLATGVDELDVDQLREGSPPEQPPALLEKEPPAPWDEKTYTLAMEASGPDIEEFRAGAPVELTERSVGEEYWPEETERLPEDERPEDDSAVDDSSGPIRIDILPKDGQVPRGLESAFYLRTTDRETGKPVASQIEFVEREGIIEGDFPEGVETDRLGLSRIKIEPVTDQRLELQARPLDPEARGAEGAQDEGAEGAQDEGAEGAQDEGAEGAQDEDGASSAAELDITTVATQVSLQMHDVIAVAGESLAGGVDTASTSGALLVDLYNAADWVEATAFGVRPERSGIRVDVPDLEAQSPLYRVQVYKHLYDAGSAWDAQYLVAADGDEMDDYRAAAERLASYLSQRVDDPYFEHLAGSELFEAAGSKAEIRRWIEAMLATVPRHFDPPPILINSQMEARQELDAWKADVKSDLLLMTALALLVGLAVVGYFVALGIRSYREQRRMLRDVDTELMLDEKAPSEASDLEERLKGGNVVAILQICIVVMTLVMFSLGILLLLSYL